MESTKKVADIDMQSIEFLVVYTGQEEHFDSTTNIDWTSSNPIIQGKLVHVDTIFGMATPLAIASRIIPPEELYGTVRRVVAPNRYDITWHTYDAITVGLDGQSAPWSALFKCADPITTEWRDSILLARQEQFKNIYTALDGVGLTKSAREGLIFCLNHHPAPLTLLDWYFELDHIVSKPTKVARVQFGYSDEPIHQALVVF
jgi:hypothetical protein